MIARASVLFVCPWLLALGGTAAGSHTRGFEALEAAARNGARPQDCAGADGFWRWHTLVRDSACARIARGYSALRNRPERALELAQQILAAEPGHVPAALLEARARVALGEFSAALVAFERAGVEGPRDLSDVAALHDLARALAELGRRADAAQAYRWLMPRSEALGDRGGVRLRATVEAAFAVMNAGAGGASEAIALLTPQLERSQYRGGESIARFTLELALSRNGSTAPVAAADPSDLDPEGPLRGTAAPRLTEKDRAALVGHAYAGRDPDVARAGWQRYLELTTPDDPFREHAQAALRRLGADPP